MRPVAGVGHLCTAYTSPYGPPAFGVVYGRLITGSTGVYGNNRIISTVGSNIYYAGWVIIRDQPTYVTWIGQVSTGAAPQINGRQIAVLGAQTNWNGQVIEGVAGIYA